jgi:hypothetical protein
LPSIDLPPSAQDQQFPGSSPGGIAGRADNYFRSKFGGGLGGRIAGAIEGKFLSADQIEAKISRSRRQLRAAENFPLGRPGTLKGIISAGAGGVLLGIFTEGRNFNAGVEVVYTLQIVNEGRISALKGEIAQLQVVLKGMRDNDLGYVDLGQSPHIDPHGSGFTTDMAMSVKSRER